MNTENGFFKIKPGDVSRAVEASYSHSFGMNEFEFGHLTSNSLTLEASEERHFQRSQVTDTADADAMANKVTSIRREYRLTKDATISFKIYIGVGGQEPQMHLQGELSKISENK